MKVKFTQKERERHSNFLSKIKKESRLNRDVYIDYSFMEEIEGIENENISILNVWYLSSKLLLEASKIGFGAFGTDGGKIHLTHCKYRRSRI